MWTLNRHLAAVENLTSAFPESGHKDWSIRAVSSGRFRPTAVMAANEDFDAAELILRYLFSEFGRVKLPYAIFKVLI